MVSRYSSLFIGVKLHYLSPFQTKVAHVQLMLVEQMTLELLYAPKPVPAPCWSHTSSRLIRPCPVTHTTRETTHCFYHLVVVRVLKVALCVFMVPVGTILALGCTRWEG